MSNQLRKSETIFYELIADGVEEQEILIEKPSDISQEDPSASDGPINEACTEQTAMETEETSAEEGEKENTRTESSYNRGSTFDPSILTTLQQYQKTKKSRRYSQKYRTQWEEMFYWCRPSPKGDLLFHCTLCRQDYNGGITELTRHAVTKKHEKNVHLSESGILLQEEAAVPPETLASPIVTIKTEGIARNATSSNIGRMTVLDQRTDQDNFAVFGKHLANKLRALTTEQNKFAQKLIMDVLFEGEMVSLDLNTKVVKCGVSCVCQQ